MSVRSSPSARARSRGVSLVEAVVALAVMGFGMLGIAAMQSSLRQNSDTARQRAEATRIASEAIEAMRSYSVVNASSGKVSYADLVSGVPAPLSLPGTITGTNATYTRTVDVTDTAAQNRKTVQVRITWADRSGQPQELLLSTEIHRSPPELAAALIVPASGTVTQLPGGRHPTIPKAAAMNSDGTSSFSPPGSGIVWKFNNASGLIQETCTPTCAGVHARLLSGYIAFATSAVQPTSLDAESPPSGPIPEFTAASPTAAVALLQTAPAAPPAAPQCYRELLPPAPAATRIVAYYCAVFTDTTTTPNYVWSGRAILAALPLSAPPVDMGSLATSVLDSSASAYRVCRYTTRRNDDPVGSGAPPMRNRDHPYDYAKVDTNLVNQNFLLIRAGDGSVAFDCPDDDPSTPLVNGRTWRHQPST